MEVLVSSIDVDKMPFDTHQVKILFHYSVNDVTTLKK